MDLKRTWITMIIFLVISAVIWAGFSTYFALTKVDVNPNAASYIQVLNAKFNTGGFDEVVERVKALPVSPATFQSLTPTTTAN